MYNQGADSGNLFKNICAAKAEEIRDQCCEDSICQAVQLDLSVFDDDDDYNDDNTIVLNHPEFNNKTLEHYMNLWGYTMYKNYDDMMLGFEYTESEGKKIIKNMSILLDSENRTKTYNLKSCHDDYFVMMH